MLSDGRIIESPYGGVRKYPKAITVGESSHKIEPVYRLAGLGIIHRLKEDFGAILGLAHSPPERRRSDGLAVIRRNTVLVHHQGRGDRCRAIPAHIISP